MCTPFRARERLIEYTNHYRDVFARADQREWFRLYVQGLLVAPGRKNVEAIASAVADEAPSGANLSQALQHFVTQSPWDHQRVLARYRELASGFMPDAALNCWVIHDGALLKKGRNSVGVQRQMARPLNRKVNCQVAVIVGLASPSSYLPLSIRLYLPAYWLRDQAALAEKTVPDRYREAATKTTIAVNLLDELLASGWAAPTAALDESHRVSAELVELLSARSVSVAGDPSPSLGSAAEAFEFLKARLGLDHFEGRTWKGWHHHAALVFAAAGFLRTQRCDRVSGPDGPKRPK